MLETLRALQAELARLTNDYKLDQPLWTRLLALRELIQRAISEAQEAER